MALASRARAPRLHCRRLSSAAPPLFSRCHSALSPALSSAPCPAALAAGPEPPRAGSAATFPAPLVLGSLPLSGLCLSNGLSCLPRSRCLPPLWSLSSPRSPSQSLLCLPQPLPYLFPARLRLPPGLVCPLSLSPLHSRCGPRCLGPRPQPLPRPRLAREPELPTPAARRELPTRCTPPRFARLSPLLTRDPRRPAAEPPPTPGAPGCLRCPGPPLPLCLAGQQTHSHPLASRGRGRAWGLHGPAPTTDPARVFPPTSRSAPPRTHSEKPPPGFQAPLPPPPAPPQGRWKGFLVLGRQWVGEGPYWVLWRWATPMSGPLSLLKYLQFRTLRIPLRRRRWPC